MFVLHFLAYEPHWFLCHSAIHDLYWFGKLGRHESIGQSWKNNEINPCDAYITHFQTGSTFCRLEGPSLHIETSEYVPWIYYHSHIHKYVAIHISKSTIIKKLCKSGNLSNHRVVMLKHPLQFTCTGTILGTMLVTTDNFWGNIRDNFGHMSRVFQHDHAVIWPSFLRVEGEVVICKGFSVWPLYHFTIFFYTFHQIYKFWFFLKRKIVNVFYTLWFCYEGMAFCF